MSKSANEVQLLQSLAQTILTAHLTIQEARELRETASWHREKLLGSKQEVAILINAYCHIAPTLTASCNAIFEPVPVIATREAISQQYTQRRYHRDMFG